MKIRRIIIRGRINIIENNNIIIISSNNDHVKANLR
jgi:hypothetical protein